VIICYFPNVAFVSTSEEQLKISFGSKVVQAIMLQPGVIKCFSPPH